MRTIANKITVRQLLRLAACTFIGLSMVACAGDDTTTSQEQGSSGDKIPAGTTIFSSVDQSDQSAPSTRTAIVDHTKGGGAKVNWSATDKIWVKDDAGTWQQSAAASFPIATNKSNARFTLNGTYTGITHDVIYTNTSITGTPQVEIKAEQTQSAPNNFDHAGESGDCGIATAHGDASGYGFTLAHKVSYLCFIPRSSNAYVNRSKLIRVEITGDDNIAGTYDIAFDGTLTLSSGGSKTITLTTGSGFDIDNPSSVMDKNAAYAVIAPGTHKLRIRYWLRNTVDGIDMSGNLSPVEGTVTKYVTMNFEAGKIHDITANLNPRNYPGNNYYMWDAQQQYWYGHEWDKVGYTAGTDQPTVNFSTGSAFPQNNTDPRYCNQTFPGIGVQYDATQAHFTSPNANEMSWYVKKGDPRWDGDELWTTMGHLYKGGMWLKKAAKIAADNSITTAQMKTIAADNSTDLRTTYTAFHNNSISSTPISTADQANYFYLPALGLYDTSMLYFVGNRGYYWSSSTQEWGRAYSLCFSSGFMYALSYNRNSGLSVAAFE